MSAAEIMQLPLNEKLQIMEAIWEDLRERADGVGISSEVRQKLDTRRARAASGESKMLDWDQVKYSIGRS